MEFLQLKCFTVIFGNEGQPLSCCHTMIFWGQSGGGMRENKAYRFPLCHAIVSHNVVASVCTDQQSPSQAQLKSPFGDSCCYYYSFITFQSRTRRCSQRYSTQDMMISDHFQSQTNYALLRTVLIKKGDIFLLEEQHENFVIFHQM